MSRASRGSAEEAAEARRLGGLRRRKEKTVAGAYDIEGLENVGQIRRLVEIAVLDTLALENSIARSRPGAGAGAASFRTGGAGLAEPQPGSLSEEDQRRRRLAE